jgi:hypothetical protein
LLKLQWLSSLIQKIEGTHQEAAAEAYNGILGFYQAVRVASEKYIPGARVIYEDIGNRFLGRKNNQICPFL